MRTSTNYFLLNLSIADLLMSSLNCVFNFIFMLNSDWPFGSIYCTINNFMATVTVSTSVFTLVAISVDRYVSLLRRLSILWEIWTRWISFGTKIMLRDFSGSVTFFRISFILLYTKKTFIQKYLLVHRKKGYYTKLDCLLLGNCKHLFMVIISLRVQALCISLLLSRGSLRRCIMYGSF